MLESISIPGLFKEISPEEIFIYSFGRNYSYSDTINIVDNYKTALQEIPLTSGYAALLAGNSAQSIFMVLALWESGIIPVMINNRLNVSEINDLLTDTPCDRIFLDSYISEAGYKIPFSKFPFDSVRPGNSTNRIIYPDDAAIIIYTSGSTGKAKGVELTFKTFIESAVLQNKFLDQNPGDKWLLSLPLYHIGGFSILFRALLNKTSVIIPESLKTGDLCNSINKFKPHFVSLVGTQVKYLLDNSFYPGDQIKNILIGGGFTDDSIINQAIGKKWKISKVYGSTETASFVAAADLNILKVHPSAAGRELNEGTIFILDEHKNILPENYEGEIALKDIPLMKGYLGNETITKNKFYNNFYLTGDVGFKNSEGILFLLMRRNDLIISGGENIDPKEVEKAIMSIDGIIDSYVFAETDMKWGQITAAAVTDTKNYSGAELRKMLKGKLAGFKIPKKFYFIKNIPRNEIGKVQFTALRKILDRE